MQKNYPNSANRNAQDTTAADDDLAVAILQDRLDDATARRQGVHRQECDVQLTALDVARLRQQGALN